MKLILDPGSTHMGKFEYARELIEQAAAAGADAVKFQLFPPGSPAARTNIPLPYGWMKDLVKYGYDKGIEVFASVWDVMGVRTLLDAGCKSVKLAYSQTHNEELLALLPNFYHAYQSYDLMNVPKTKNKNDIFLYCIPEYPVRYWVDWLPLYKTKTFDGFSDHTMGIGQTKVAATVTGIIEKHFKLDHDDIDCPDARFAITFDEVRELTKINVDYYSSTILNRSSR